MFSFYQNTRQAVTTSFRLHAWLLHAKYVLQYTLIWNGRNLKGGFQVSPVPDMVIAPARPNQMPLLRVPAFTRYGRPMMLKLSRYHRRDPSSEVKDLIDLQALSLYMD